MEGEGQRVSLLVGETRARVRERERAIQERNQIASVAESEGEIQVGRHEGDRHRLGVEVCEMQKMGPMAI